MKAATVMTQQIKAMKVECGVPEEQAHAEAVAVVEKKVSRTKLGMLVAVIGIGGGLYAKSLGMATWLTFGSVIGGCLTGAHIWSGELLGAIIKGFFESLAAGIKAIKGAVTGG